MIKFFFGFLFLAGSLLAQTNTKDYYLSPEDQKYFKNDAMEGNNQFERINMNVKELNKLHGDVAALKAEVQVLKKEIEELKKGK
jgi:cell division protein FtsB